nr:MAG: hypothetical protein [Bacteriophage sp.]
MLDKNDEYIEIKIPSYVSLYESLHDGEYIIAISFNKSDNIYTVTTNDGRTINIDVNWDEYNKQLTGSTNGEKQVDSNRNVDINAEVTADQLKSGKIKPDSISNLEEGTYNLNDGSILRVFKNPDSTTIGITKYIDEADGSTHEDVVKI